MTTPVNSRRAALEATSPRILQVGDNYINLTVTSQQFKIGTDNQPNPASVTITANLVGVLAGTVTFNTNVVPNQFVAGTTFTGTIALNSNILTTINTPGVPAVGMELTGGNIQPGTYIVSGSGTNWIVSKTQTLATSAATLTGSPHTRSGNTLTITPAIMASDYVTVTASITYQNVTYTSAPVSITKIYNSIQARLSQTFKIYASYDDGTGYNIPLPISQLNSTDRIYLDLYNGDYAFNRGTAGNITYSPLANTVVAKNGLKVYLSSGDPSIDPTITGTSITTGNVYKIATTGNQTAFGAANNTVGTIFTATQNGTLTSGTVSIIFSAGQVIIEEDTPGSWTTLDPTNFTLTATRSGVNYSAIFNVSKQRQGMGGIQYGTISLYRWSAIDPSANQGALLPKGTSTYTWYSQSHVYNPTAVQGNLDSWTVAIPTKPTDNYTYLLWKITKSVQQQSARDVTIQTLTGITWTSDYKLTEVTTTSNEFVKTKTATLYQNGIGAAPDAPTGSAVYNWTTETLDVSGTSLNFWTVTIPAEQEGVALYTFNVDLIESKTTTSTTVYWDKGYSKLVTIYGKNSIVARFDNGTHAIPCDYLDSEASRNFSNSGTKLVAYDGTTVLTAISDDTVFSKGTYKVSTAADGVTVGTKTVGGTAGFTFGNITAATFASTTTGSITFTLTGQTLTGTAFTYKLVQTFTKTPRGDPGINYWIVTDASVISKSLGGAFTPSTITVTAKKSVAGVASDYAGWFKIYKNSDPAAVYTSNAAESSKTYTIPADTTQLKFRVYDSNPDAQTGSKIILDEEIVPVVNDGPTGNIGNSARRAYVKTTTTPASSGDNGPSTYTATGDALPRDNVWFTKDVATGRGVWASTPQQIAEGETLYQSDGIFVYGGNTTWGFPYISALKVGNLSAITVNTGDLYVSGSIRGGANSTKDSTIDLTTGSGYYISSTGSFRIGNPTTNYLKWDGTDLTINTTGAVKIGNTTNYFDWTGTALNIKTAGAVTIGNPTGARLVWDGSALSIYNSSNTAILTAGKLTWTAVGDIPYSVVGNLLDTSTWVTGADYSATGPAGFNLNQNATSENSIIVDIGPDGTPKQIWKAYSTENFTGSEDPDGGWNTSNFTIDHLKPYRFSCWIKRASSQATGSAWLGLGGNTVTNLAGVLNSNPYFIAGYGRVSLIQDRWYLFVGYVWPSTYTGNTNLGGIYDGITGELVYAGTSWKWVSGQTTSIHRCYQYYSNIGDIQYFYGPRVDIADGSEPTIEMLLALGKATTAASTANTAANTANTASTTAGTAANTANTAAGTANTAANTANTASTTAGTAANTANTAAGTANTAAGTANTAANTANTASTTAGTAANTANTASNRANTAANTANTAANTANIAANTANTAANTVTAAVQLVGSVTWLGDTTVSIITGVELRKDGAGATAGNNAQRYSSESFVGGAYLSFQPYALNTQFAMGLNTDPTTDKLPDSIDYCWTCASNNTLFITLNNATPTYTNSPGSWTTDTILSIIYDNQYVRFYKDTTLICEVDTTYGSAKRLYVDSSFSTVGSGAKNIRFGPNATRGAPGVGVNGARGSVTIYKASTLTGWTDAAAVLAVTEFYSTVSINDTVTLYNSTAATPWATTKFWNNSAWVEVTTVINGNLLVKGTVGADVLSANSIIGNNISFTGLLSTKSATTGARMEITNSTILVYDGTITTPRIKIGNLS